MNIQSDLDRRVIEQLFEIGVLLEHDKRRKSSPHVLLNGGGHTNSYCDVRKLNNHPKLFLELCEHLFTLDQMSGEEESTVYNQVNGPNSSVVFLGIATGGIEIAKALHNIAKQSDSSWTKFDWGYAERLNRETNLWDILEIAPSNLIEPRVILCDDVLTTGETASALARFLKEQYGVWVEEDLFCIFNRSESIIPNIQPFYAIGVIDEIYPPDKCPMCARGSVAISPNEPGALYEIFGRRDD